MQPLIPAPPAHDHSRIPIYKLYGYGNVWTQADPLFCETIAAQEKLHNWHVQPHKHIDLYQILYLESGHMRVMLDGIRKSLDAPQILLVPQNVVHEFIFQPQSSGYILTLTYTLLRERCKALGLGLNAMREAQICPLKPDAEDRNVVACLHHLNRTYHEPLSARRGPLLEALVTILLAWIETLQDQDQQAVAPTRDPGSRHLARYAQLIEDHHTQQHKVKWYAQRIGVTPAHLNAIARELTGRSALQLVHDRLMLQARRELIYTTRTIATISESLGFVDTAYFARFFKRLDGRSPKAFRQQTANAGRAHSQEQPEAEHPPTQ